MKKQTAPYSCLAVIGLGLIGGSLALDFKKHRLAKKIIGVSRSAQNRKEALRRKAVDEVFAAPGPFLQEADLIVIATPVESILTLLSQIQKWLKSDAMVTDVGSSKSKIVKQAQKLGLKNFVGGHPIAGTEHSGMKAAVLGLFAGKKWILTPTSSQASSRKLKAVLQKIGAQVLEMKAEAHDKMLASVSHVPNLLAYALALSVGKKDAKQKLKLAGSSLKGMTRVAASPPEMWRDICLSNAKEITLSLADLQSELSKLEKALKSADSKNLMKLLYMGRSFRLSLEKNI